MVRQKLFEDRKVCVLPARHLYAKRLTLERFATLPHFQLSPRRLNEDFVDAALKKHQLTRTVVARVPHFTAAPQLVLAAKGIAVAPGARLECFGPARGGSAAAAAGLQHGLVLPETSRHDPAHLWFRRLLTGCVRV